MMPLVRNLGIAGSLVLVSTLFTIPQTQAQSAYVYVQSTGSAGPVYGYSASYSGQLTAISGSPFKPGTAIVGGTKTEFFTTGKTLLHSWSVGSNGAIGSQLSQIPFLNYSGSSCGSETSGLASGELDHSGQYIYLLLENGGDGSCAAYQTYKINSGGTFTFDGDTEVNFGVQSGPNFLSVDLPSILGNETFGYADESSGHYSNPIANLSTTNTQSNMPTSQLDNPGSRFSPEGKMFALYANAMDGVGGPGNGIEIYNFNGASPLTLYKRILTGTPIDQAAWDSSNHLYAISRSLNKLYVFTVTSTSVTQNSSISITNPLNMVVVSHTASSCSAPSANGVNVCSPAENASVSSPVQINARATVSGGIYRFELWSGSTKLVSVANSGIMNQTVSLAPGTYRLSFVARNTAGTRVTATRDIMVK
jgi:hypothetical protein